MEREEHIQRHKELHRSLDELLADYIRHNSPDNMFTTPLWTFLIWSSKQTLNPDPDPDEPEVKD